MNLTAPPRPHNDRFDQWTIRVGFLLVAVIAVIQHHQHTGWFYNPNAATASREAVQSHKESTNPPVTHSRGSVPAARTRCTFRYSVNGAAALVGTKLHPCRLV
jgi:hypothetical protein